MNFPGRVYHRDFGPRLIQNFEEFAELVIRHGFGWHSDPVAAARGEHEAVELAERVLEIAGVPAAVAEVVVPVVSDVVAAFISEPHADPGAFPPAVAIIEALAPDALLGVSDAELEALTAPAMPANVSLKQGETK